MQGEYVYEELAAAVKPIPKGKAPVINALTVEILERMLKARIEDTMLPLDAVQDGVR